MISNFIDSCLLFLFVRIGSMWFNNIAFNCDPKTERVRHMIFAQDGKWLANIIEVIEREDKKK